MNFIVKYSQELDIQTWLNKVWKNNYVDYGDRNKENYYKWAPKEFIDNLSIAPDKESAENIIKQYLKDSSLATFEKDNEFLVDWYGRLLNEEKDSIIQRLEKAYGKPFPFGDITIYLTTCFSCPYNYDKLYFFIGRNFGIFGVIDTARHELNHFMFYYYHCNSLKERNISIENIEYLKEAMAILTSDKKTENSGRSSQILKIEDFVKQNKNLSIKEIIDLVIENNFFANIN